ADADRADGGRVRPDRAPKCVPQSAREAPLLEAPLRDRHACRGGGAGEEGREGRRPDERAQAEPGRSRQDGCATIAEAPDGLTAGLPSAARRREASPELRRLITCRASPPRPRRTLRAARHCPPAAR